MQRVAHGTFGCYSDPGDALTMQLSPRQHQSHVSNTTRALLLWGQHPADNQPPSRRMALTPVSVGAELALPKAAAADDAADDDVAPELSGPFPFILAACHLFGDCCPRMMQGDVGAFCSMCRYVCGYKIQTACRLPRADAAVLAKSARRRERPCDICDPCLQMNAFRRRGGRGSNILEKEKEICLSPLLFPYFFFGKIGNIKKNTKYKKKGPSSSSIFIWGMIIQIPSSSVQK